MSTDNICLYKEVARKYTCCNLKTTELLNCALIGVCAVIRSNTVLGQSGLSTRFTLSIGTSYLHVLTIIVLKREIPYLI